MQQVLELVVLCGVDVRVLLPRHSDQKVVHWAGLSYAEQLQNKGVEIYLYDKGFSHQKVVLVDDEVCGIGTSNFDNRAMYLNFETTVLTFHEGFSKQVEQMLLNDFYDARHFKPQDDRIIRRFIGLRDHSARLLAPLL